MTACSRRLVLVVAALALTRWSVAARADAPAGRFAAAGGIVTDAKTGLRWQQTLDKAGTLAEVKAYCASLDLQGTGWRVPTMKELETIVDDSRYQPALDPIFAFGITAFSWVIWSSTPLSGLESSYGWFVSFSDGSAWYQYEVAKGAARCVR